MEARCDFEDIPSGTTPWSLHEETMNGKLDPNWIGIPKETHRLSNEARASSRTRLGHREMSAQRAQRSFPLTTLIPSRSS